MTRTAIPLLAAALAPLLHLPARADDRPAALDLESLRADARAVVSILGPAEEDMRLPDRIASFGVDLAIAAARSGGRLVWSRVAREHYARPEDGEAAEAAIGAMVGELDPDWLAFFPEEVASLSADPRVRRFLDAVPRLVADPDVAVDLWTLARGHAGSDDEAIRWLAVLFQDLEVQPMGHLRAVRDRVDRERLATAMLALERSDPERVRLYPSGVGLARRYLYHYYVPALLAVRLRAVGHRPGMAFLAPFVMNTEYERLGLAIEGGADEEVLLAGPARGFDPGAAGEGELEESIHDVYLGYRGALLGAGLDADPATLEAFDRGLRDEPGPFVRRLAADRAR